MVHHIITSVKEYYLYVIRYWHHGFRPQAEPISFAKVA
jgi:hypothetical protein